MTPCGLTRWIVGLYKYPLTHLLFHLTTPTTAVPHIAAPPFCVHWENTLPSSISGSPQSTSQRFLRLPKSRLDTATMALAKTKTAQTSTTMDSVSNVKSDITQKLLTMFPERPSGVSWADWADDEEEEEDTIVDTIEAPSVVEPKRKKEKEPEPGPEPYHHLSPPSPPKAAVNKTTKDESDRIESYPQRISFDTAVPKPILLNPSMKPNELGLSASRWASFEPEEADEAAKDEEPTEARHETPATTPEPVEPATPAKPVAPKPKKAAEPGLMASRWAS